MPSLSRKVASYARRVVGRATGRLAASSAADDAAPFRIARSYVDSFHARAVMAAIYLKGEGIEIGAAHQPLDVPEGVRVRYVDRMSADDLRRAYPELEGRTLVPVD